MSKKFYYDKDDFKLLHGDALLLLKKIEQKSIDMIFADPPYFLSNDGLTIQNGEISSTNQSVGYIIREEKLFQGDNYKNGIYQIKTEGQKVAKGDPIFRYYTNNEENLTQKISELFNTTFTGISHELYDLLFSPLLNVNVNGNVILLYVTLLLFKSLPQMNSSTLSHFVV